MIYVQPKHLSKIAEEIVKLAYDVKTEKNDVTISGITPKW